MIIIYSKKRDQFVNSVIDLLEMDTYFRISQDNGFKYLSSEFNNDGTSNSFVKNNYSKEINLHDIKSIWYNGGVINLNKNKNSKELNQLLQENLNLIIDGVIASRDIKNIGSIKNNRKGNKIKNLLTSSNLGLTIPKTLITVNKNSLIDFIKKQNKSGIICKRINESDKFIENEIIFDNSKTFLVTEKFVNELSEVFGLSLFQERIEKQFEIRVICFNDVFYASAIFDGIDSVDYRINLNQNNNRPRIIPYQLPKKIENKLKKIMQTLNYSFCSIDLIYDKNDRYIFLEINPCGQISFINNACNFYLEKHFAKYLND